MTNNGTTNIYFGKLKEKPGLYGNFFIGYINEKILSQYANEKGFVNIIISKLKSPDIYGNTHTIALNKIIKQNKEGSNNSNTNNIKK